MLSAPLERTPGPANPSSFARSNSWIGWRSRRGVAGQRARCRAPGRGGRCRRRSSRCRDRRSIDGLAAVGDAGAVTIGVDQPVGRLRAAADHVVVAALAADRRRRRRRPRCSRRHRRERPTSPGRPRSRRCRFAEHASMSASPSHRVRPTDRSLPMSSNVTSGPVRSRLDRAMIALSPVDHVGPEVAVHDRLADVPLSP